MKSFIFSISFFILLISSGCGGSSSGSNPNMKLDFQMPKPTQARQKYLMDSAQGYFDRWVGRGAFSGQFLLAKNGHVIFSKASGFSKVETGEKMTLDTRIHVASISKVATALAILRLVDQGKVALNQKVSFYLPKFPYKAITVRMLLNHRSGLANYIYFADEFTDRKTVLTNKDLIPLMRKHKIPLNAKPCTHFAYCNTNYAVLALIVEKATSLSFPKAMEQLLFKPLDMDHSLIASNKKDYDAFSRNYKQNNFWNGFTYQDAVYGDKNLYTTAFDLVKLDRATYFSSFLSDSLRKQMYRGYSYEHPGIRNYGLGVRLKEKKGKNTFFFHTGWWHGNTGIYCSLRKDTICIIAISNNMNKRVYNQGPLVKACGNYVINDEE